MQLIVITTLSVIAARSALYNVGPLHIEIPLDYDTLQS